MQEIRIKEKRQREKTLEVGGLWRLRLNDAMTQRRYDTLREG